MSDKKNNRKSGVSLLKHLSGTWGAIASGFAIFATGFGCCSYIESGREELEIIRLESKYSAELKELNEIIFELRIDNKLLKQSMKNSNE